MHKKESYFFNTLFEFDNYACSCALDVENISPYEEPKVTLKFISSPAKPLHYCYVPQEGLSLSGISGGNVDSGILGRLLAIPDNDVDAHISFFKTYGFLVPIDGSDYESIDASALVEVVNRIKATIGLMNSIAKRNYRSMLRDVAYLLYAPEITIELSKHTITTCRHRFSEILSNRPLFPDISRDPEVAAKGTYSVPDTILKKNNHIDYAFFNAVRQGQKTSLVGSESQKFRSLMAAYVGCHNEPANVRKQLDFLFHFQTNIAVFKQVSFKTLETYSAIEDDDFSDEIKLNLLDVAKIVVSEEINHNINRIHPVYDQANLTPSWQIDTFLQALYFSIFYMKAGLEIYKECENPNCTREKYFLVETTRSNKKYCCPQCANAAAAQRHRNRKLLK